MLVQLTGLSQIIQSIAISVVFNNLANNYKNNSKVEKIFSTFVVI